MKKIGFLSFGHWANHPAYKTRTAGDTLLQSIDLAVAAEEMQLPGADLSGRDGHGIFEVFLAPRPTAPQGSFRIEPRDRLDRAARARLTLCGGRRDCARSA